MVDFHAIRGTADFIFMRHGESEGNRERVAQGRQPSRLTEQGREQARAAGRALARRPPDAVLSSPLTRALETAEIAAKEFGAGDIMVCDELMEIDTGIFTGLTFPQSHERHPKEWIEFHSRSWEAVPGAEKIEELTARAASVWSRLIGMAGQGKRNILSVSHSGFIQWIVRVTFGLNAWMPLLDISRNCGITLMRVDNKDLEDGSRSYYANWAMINLPPELAFPARAFPAG